MLLWTRVPGWGLSFSVMVKTCPPVDQPRHGYTALLSKTPQGKQLQWLLLLLQERADWSSLLRADTLRWIEPISD